MEKQQDETLNEDVKNPSGDGQPENSDDSKIETSDVGSEEPQKEEEKNETEAETKEESVTIPKAELDKIKRDLENYKRGLLAYKTKNRKLPLSTRAKKERSEDVWDEEPDESDKFVTKEEYYANVEQTAISKALSDDSLKGLDDNWDKVMEYYTDRHGKTVDGLVENIKDAYYLWKIRQPNPPKEEEIKTKKDISKLAQEKQISKGKEVKSTPQKKSILPKQKPMEEWYK